MSRRLIVLLVSVSFFCFCSKTAEQKGDVFLKNGNRRNAYIFYQKAIQKSKNPERKLKNKYLSLTTNMAKERLIDDESMGSLRFYHEDFMKLADNKTDPAILRNYSGFLCEWADSMFIKREDLETALIILKDAEKIDPSNKNVTEKEKMLTQKYGALVLERAKTAYKEGKKEDNALKVVKAEYYTLCALKELPNNNEAKKLLKKTRKANLCVYAAYDRAMDDGITDPEVDKYNVYMAITNQRRSRRRGVMLEGSIYSLSPDGPIELQSKQFILVDKKGNKHRASMASKFQKITIEAKIESKFTLKFPTAKDCSVEKLIFNDGKRVSEKWFP